MAYLRFLVTVICIGISTSFVRVSYINNGARAGRAYKLSEAAESASLGDILGQIRDTPEKLSENVRRISERIQATPGEISENIQIISDKIQAAPGQISRNVKEVTDAVVYFPSNVTATVAETQSNIQERTDAVKRNVRALSPLPFINKALTFSKTVIDTAYELKEGKIDGGKALAKFKPIEIVKPVKVKSVKSPEEAYEEAKENIYTTIDNIKGFGRGVVATAERVQQLPNDVTKTRESVVLTAEILQKDFTEIQNQASDLGKVVWKVVTLEAAKETYERTEKQYQSTVKYVEDTKTMLLTNPTAIFTNKEKEKQKQLQELQKKQKDLELLELKSQIKIAPKIKVENPFTKIMDAVKITKSGVEATISTVQEVSKGVKGLKNRIDRDIAIQSGGTYNSGINSGIGSGSGSKVQVSSYAYSSAPPSYSDIDTSELTYSSSSSSSFSPSQTSSSSSSSTSSIIVESQSQSESQSQVSASSFSIINDENNITENNSVDDIVETSVTVTEKVIEEVNEIIVDNSVELEVVKDIAVTVSVEMEPELDSTDSTGFDSMDSLAGDTGSGSGSVSGSGSGSGSGGGSYGNDGGSDGSGSGI